jgi:cell division septal protein FtsQ
MRAAAGSSAEPSEPRITVEQPPVKRHFFRRRANRRITVARPSIAGWVASGLRAAAIKLVVLGKVLVAAAFVAGALWAGRKVVQHVIASPRFAVHDIEVGPSTRVSPDEIRDLCGVRLGDRLLAVDPDAVAARLATHPWILSARVRRELPSTLAIEVTERQAAASALLGALYLLDGAGRPFKRATFAEADGLPVITGVTRDQYAAVRGTSEAVFRQALGLYRSYADGHPERPKLSEVHVDTRAGFTLVLYDGSGEIRLGRGDFEDKLARLDRIFAALGNRGPAALQTVYLDGPLSDRITIRMATAAPDDPAHPHPVLASEKPRPAKKHPETPAEPASSSDED